MKNDNTYKHLNELMQTSSSEQMSVLLNKSHEFKFPELKLSPRIRNWIFFTFMVSTVVFTFICNYFFQFHYAAYFILIIGFIFFYIMVRLNNRSYESQKLVFELAHKLGDKEMKYTALYHAIPDMVFISDYESGVIEDANAKAVQQYQYSLEELTSFTNGDLSVNGEEFKSEALGHTTYVPIKYHRRKDGELFPVEITQSSFLFNGVRKVILVVRDITSRVNFEQVKVKLNDHLQKEIKILERQENLKSILFAQEEERKKIARELHDTLSQDLFAHRLHIERVSLDYKKNSGAFLEKSLMTLESETLQMVKGLQQIMFDLRPSVLDEMGFVKSIPWYLELVEAENYIKSNFKIEGEEVKLGYEVEVNLFRIFQESLTNIVAHAEASNITVELVFTSKTITLTIADDGQGFDTNNVKLGMKKGLGLLGMQERADLIKAEFSIISNNETGTKITIKSPIR